MNEPKFTKWPFSDVEVNVDNSYWEKEWRKRVKKGKSGDSMKNHTFLEGDKVIVHSIGEQHKGKEYRAIVRGVSIDWGINPATIYIVQAVDKIIPDWSYSHYTMPESCLRRDENAVKNE